MTRRGVIPIAMLALLGSGGHAGVAPEIEEEYAQRLVGQSLTTRIDVKIIRIVKQVKGGNLEQIKDATEVTAQGARYRDEARATEWTVAPERSILIVEGIDFRRKSVELELRPVNQREPVVVTFVFDEKLDPGFSLRPLFESMMERTFAGVPAPLDPAAEPPAP